MSGPLVKLAGSRSVAWLLVLMAGLLCSTSALAQGICPAGNVRVAPNSRYVQLAPGPVGENIVLDVVTALVWKQCPQGLSGAACAVGSASLLTWSGALTAADGENFGGFGDWRLPNRNELRSLVERGCWAPAINTTLFPGTTNASVWSSTTRVALTTHAWAVSFGDGGTEISPKSGTQVVRLVRGGERLEDFDSGLDFTPAAFNFASQTNVPANSLRTSAAIVVSGLGGAVSIGVSGAASSEYRINAGAFTALPGVVRNTDQVQVRHLSANVAEQATTTTLQIGNLSADFVSTTAGVLIFANGFEAVMP